MKILIKFIAVFIVLVVSIMGANISNQALEKTQNNVVKAYKRKRTEERSFKNIEEANSYILDKGTKIEAIAKELGIEYVMSDDKGLFYHSDYNLTQDTTDNYYDVNSIQIEWATGMLEYGGLYSEASTTTFHENMYLFSYGDFLNKEDFKDNLVVKFLYKYLVIVENQSIDYDQFLNDIQKTCQKYRDESPEEGVRLQLVDGLYILFKSSDKIEVKTNVAYRERVIKEANQDFSDYFITCKNSKEVKDRIFKIYEHYDQLNEVAGNYKHSGVYIRRYKDYESVAIDMCEPSVSVYYYNKKIYPNLTEEDKIYSIEGNVYSNKEYYASNYSVIEYEKYCREQASILYELIKNEIYQGTYKMSKEEFISKYVKNSLNEKLDILYNAGNLHGIYYITPGISPYERGGLSYDIPLKFN